MGDELQRYHYEFYCRKCQKMKFLEDLKEVSINSNDPNKYRIVCTCGIDFFSMEKIYYH